MIQTFRPKGIPSESEIKAIGIRSLYAEGRRVLPERVPIAHLGAAERKLIFGQAKADRRLYEIATLAALRERLRSADIWVEGSRAWRSFEDYLLPRPIFALMRAEGRLGLAIPDSFAEWRAERTATLDAKLKELARAAAANAATVFFMGNMLGGGGLCGPCTGGFL